jgi:hypothetical protein
MIFRENAITKAGSRELEAGRIFRFKSVENRKKPPLRAVTCFYGKNIPELSDCKSALSYQRHV